MSIITEEREENPLSEPWHDVTLLTSKEVLLQGWIWSLEFEMLGLGNIFGPNSEVTCKEGTVIIISWQMGESPSECK